MINCGSYREGFHSPVLKTRFFSVKGKRIDGIFCMFWLFTNFFFLKMSIYVFTVLLTWDLTWDLVEGDAGYIT